MKNIIVYVIYNDGMAMKNVFTEDEAKAIVSTYDGDHAVWYEAKEVEVEDESEALKVEDNKMKRDVLKAVVGMYAGILSYLEKNKEAIIKQHDEATFNTIWMDTASASNNVLIYV